MVSRDRTRDVGFTLSALVHNEMHFLPSFLAHCRRLGVERFIIIDDRSTDGTSAYLNGLSDVMIDMYPATVSDLAGMAEDPVVDLKKPWFFDGQKHLRIRAEKTPKMVHAGSRARLLGEFDLNEKRSWIECRLRKLLRLPSPRHNAIRKPIFVAVAKRHRIATFSAAP